MRAMQFISVGLGLICLSSQVHGGCLGAGTGAGSCPAAPFRADEAEIDHKSGCPQHAECCTEYGYCHPKSSWDAGYFRDCNGESNGQDLPLETIEAEKICSGEVLEEEPLPAYEEPQPVYEEPQPAYEEPQPSYEQPPPPQTEPPALYGPPPTSPPATQPPPPPPSYLPPAGERTGRKQKPRRPTPKGFSRRPKIFVEQSFSPPSGNRGGSGGGGGNGRGGGNGNGGGNGRGRGGKEGPGGPVGGVGGIGGGGPSGPDGNCAWNGPGGCDGDKQRQGRTEGNRQEKALKPRKPKAEGPRAVGSRLWTVEQWLKHG